MMHVVNAGTSEVAISGRVLETDNATLEVAAAQAILNFDFRQADRDRNARIAGQSQERDSHGREAG